MKEWSAWYESMQPSWRSSLSRVVEANADWSPLAKGGNNGLYVLLLSIGWWIFALRDGDLSDELLAAIDDIKWVFGQVRNYLATKKRPAENDLDSGETNVKRYGSLPDVSCLENDNFFDTDCVQNKLSTPRPTIANPISVIFLTVFHRLS